MLIISSVFTTNNHHSRHLIGRKEIVWTFPKEDAQTIVYTLHILNRYENTTFPLASRLAATFPLVQLFYIFLKCDELINEMDSSHSKGS